MRPITFLLTFSLSSMCGVAWADPSGAQSAERKEAEQREMNKRIRHWQAIFGKKVQFEKRRYFICVDYIYPQPVSELRDIGDLILDPYVLEKSERWFNRLLKKGVRPRNIVRFPPEKYYLLKETADESLLLHEWRAGNYQFRAYENDDGILLRIAPNGYQPGTPLSDKALAKVIRDVIALDYKSDEEVIKAFHLPDTIKPGQFFANGKSFWLLGDWHDRVAGFLSEHDVCIICYKKEGDPMDGFSYRNRYWLNQNLFQKDGKTLVAPPPKEDR